MQFETRNCLLHVREEKINIQDILSGQKNHILLKLGR